MTFPELVCAINAWLNRPEAEPHVPTFVALAEAQVSRRLAEAGVMGAVVRATASIASEYCGVPDDFGLPLSITLADGTRLDAVTAAGFLAQKARLGSGAGKPVCYTVAGRELRLAPVPDKAYSAELVYQARLSPLSLANPANWLLDHHADVYLYGALTQAAPFLGEDGRLALWDGLYERGLEGVIEAERATRGSRLTPAFRSEIADVMACHG
jgi:hypothetical protein